MRVLVHITWQWKFKPDINAEDVCVGHGISPPTTIYIYILAIAKVQQQKQIS